MSGISFYCRDCELDQELWASKINNDILVINSLTDFYWKKNEIFREYYIARCEECNRDLIRFKDRPQEDPYYHLSKRVKIQRQQLAKDLVQYGDTGFKTLYRKQWLDFEKQREEYETKQKQKELGRKELLDKNSTQRRALEKVFALEDKLST